MFFVSRGPSTSGGLHGRARHSRGIADDVRRPRLFLPCRVQEDAPLAALPSGADLVGCPPERLDSRAWHRVCRELRSFARRVVSLFLALTLSAGVCFPQYSFAVGFVLPLGLGLAELAPYVLGAVGLAAFGISFADMQEQEAAYEAANGSLWSAMEASAGEGYEWMVKCHNDYTASSTGALTISAKDIPTSVYQDVAKTYQDSYSAGSFGSYGSAPSNPSYTYASGIVFGTSCTLPAYPDASALSGYHFVGCQYSNADHSAGQAIYAKDGTAPTCDWVMSSENIVNPTIRGKLKTYMVWSASTIDSPRSTNYASITSPYGFGGVVDPSMPFTGNSPLKSNPAWSSVGATAGIASGLGATAYGLGAGLTDGTYTPAQVAPEAAANLAGSDIVVATPDAYAGDWATVVTTPATPDNPDVPDVDPPLYIPILSDIAQGIADVLAWLASAIFNTHVLSFDDSALSALAGAFGLSGLFSSVVDAIEALPDAIDWPWTLPDLQGIGEDVVGGVVGGILAGLGIDGALGFWDQLRAALNAGIGVDVLGWDDFMGTLSGIGDDVLDIPAVLTGIGDDVLGALRSLGDILSGTLTTTWTWADGVLEALRAALEGLGVNVGELDFTSILDALAAIPAAIASALGLEWFLEHTDDLRSRLPDLSETLILPTATWDQFRSAAEGLAVVRVANGLRDGLGSLFDTIGGGSQGQSGPPRYEIDFSVLGYPVHFVIDFGVFNQDYVLYAHGFMYVLFIIWLFGFSERVHRWLVSHISGLLAVRGD